MPEQILQPRHQFPERLFVRIDRHPILTNIAGRVDVDAAVFGQSGKDDGKRSSFRFERNGNLQPCICLHPGRTRRIRQIMNAVCRGSRICLGNQQP